MTIRPTGDDLDFVTVDVPDDVVDGGNWGTVPYVPGDAVKPGYASMSASPPRATQWVGQILTGPALTLAITAGADLVEPVTGTFLTTWTFNQDVLNSVHGTVPDSASFVPAERFSLDDIEVIGTTASGATVSGGTGSPNLTTLDSRVFTAGVIPPADFEGTLRVRVPAEAVWTAHGTTNPEAVLEVRADTLAPALTGAAVAGNALTLAYHEPLDDGSMPGKDDFAVAVDDTARGVGGVAMSGSTVTLTLASAVAGGSTVTVTYEPPVDGALRDLAGNPAAALTGRAVMNQSVGVVVSIAAERSPVTEGAGAHAVFTLVRAGSILEALTVGVRVTETASFIAGSAPSEVTFTAGAAQASLSVALDDDTVGEFDGGTITAALDDGAGYAVSITAGAAAVRVIDDDERLRVGFAAPAPEVAEGAGAVTLTVVARTAPGVAPVALGDGTVGLETQTGTATAELDFTALSVTALGIGTGDWQADGDGRVARTEVKIAILDDALHEGNESFTVTPVRGLQAPAGLALDSATVTIADDEPTPRATLMLSPETLGERGAVAAVAAVTAALDGPSGADTTVAVNAAAVAPATAADFTLSAERTLTIAAGATASTGTVTITAVDNDADAPDKRVTVAGTGDNPLGVLGPSAAAALLIVDDDPTPGVTLLLEPPRIERGAVATVTAVLDRPSSADTTVAVTAAAVAPAAAADFTLSAGRTLTIAAGATASTGTVTITAVDNDLTAADKQVTVSGTAANAWAVDGPSEQTLTIAADDGVTVEPTALTVAEGGSGSYAVVLNTEPAADVVVSVAGASGTDLSLSGTELTYTTSNWSTEQTVTVTAGEDDDSAADTVKLTHTAASTDSDYEGATVDEVTVTITDNDAAGVTVEPTALTVAEGGSGSYAVVLNTEPAADVVVSVAGASGTDLSLSATELTYTTSSWSTEQTVTVTVTAGEDDDSAADTVKLTHTAASTDSDYEGATVDEVTVTITDNDTAGVTVEPTALTVAEGGSGSYAVVLNTEPAADVVVSVAGASGTDLSLSGTELTYTTSNWSTEQTVTVTAGEDDDSAADTVKLTHTAASTDSDYDGATVDEVTVTITDNDAAGVTVEPTALTVAEGGSGSYTVVLNTEPAADVVVSVAGASGTDLSLSGTELTYTTSNWSTEQTVTVTAGEDDDSAADTVKLTHTAASTDSDYEGATVDEVTVTITDNDAAGVTVEPTALTVAEGGSGSYTVVLNTEPAADVVVSVAGASGTDLSLSATELTYTTSNWSTEQTVTVTAGEDDDSAADTVKLTHTAASTDSDYDGATVDEVTVTITDNDAAGGYGADGDGQRWSRRR